MLYEHVPNDNEIRKGIYIILFESPNKKPKTYQQECNLLLHCQSDNQEFLKNKIFAIVQSFIFEFISRK